VRIAAGAWHSLSRAGILVLLGGLATAGLATCATPTDAASQQTVRGIVLSPQAITLPNSPIAGHAGRPEANISVSLRALNSAGQPIRSGQFTQPIKLHVYGPPGVLIARTTSIGSPRPTISFRYTGRAVRNPVIVTATAGPAFALISFQPKHQGFSGSQAKTFRLANPARNLARGWDFIASVAGGRSHLVEMDTGSRGLVVPASVLGPGAVGPGPAGRIEYSSDGKIFSGHFYLAPVTLRAGRTSVTTVPIELLGVDHASCDLARYPKCKPGKLAGLGVMGVGFDRHGLTGLPARMPPELTNVFLALTNVIEGAMHPGYLIASATVTLGITPGNSAGFLEVPLKRGGTGPGDWNTEPGCFSFPEISGYGPRCGTVLVDTGIASAILGLPRSQRPPAIATSIPAGQRIAIDVAQNARTSPVLSYSFRVGDRGPSTPTAIRWAAGKAPFVNTGRRPISQHSYLFDAGSGAVGFKSPFG
jgi:hypothetical protein